jgi:alpha-L-rhamnosidase
MRRLVRFAILACLATASAARANVTDEVERVAPLRTNGAVEPLGIDTAVPRFTWALESTRRGVMQTAYRVTVGRSEAGARRGELWDSGRVESSDPWALYAGPALGSRARYFWTVQAWATGGFRADAAPPTWFETAYLDPSEWRGDWIAGPERRLTRSTPEAGRADDAAVRAAGEFCRPVGWLTTGFSARTPNDQGECRELRPAPLLRKTFEVTKTVARARLYASGLGYARVFVSEAPASARVLDPAFTSYGRTVLYTTDDVTALLRPGRNAIAVELGSGRFDDATRTWDWGWDEAEWRATPRLRLDLRIDYADGTEEVVGTDGSWKVSTDGPHRFDSLYLGETYDARRERPFWWELHLDDSRWAPARVVDGPAGVLRAQAQQPIEVMRAHAPGVRSEPAPGVVVYDVGLNLTGWAVIRVRAPAGAAIEVFYSEKLDGTGRASTDGNALVYGQLQTDHYVARGGGDEVWTPSFSYKGFQYIQVSGPSGTSLPAGASVSVERIEEVRSALPRTSSFRSDQPTLDRIHASTVRAVQSNLHGIVTDTPVYEKNAWTGDAALMAGTTPLLFDAERLYRKMIQDMSDAQTPEGELPLLCPSNRNYGYVGKPYFKPPECCGATPAWDAFWFEIPWESYRHYGDTRTLAAAYPGMQRYLDDWVPRWTGKDGDAFGQTLTSGLGDWLPPKGVPTLDALVSTAYYARLVRIAADTAGVLEREADAARYRDLFARIRSDFNARFLGPDGVYRDTAGEPFAQSAQVLPLAFGLAPDDGRAALVERLAADLASRGGNASVGVIGARHVLPVLTAEGRHDAAFDAATQTDEPSWGFWTDVLHFTSLGESWPADTRSRNHHFFGAIVQWLYEDLAGIRPLEAGYGRILIEPRIPTKGLGRVSASYASVRGGVASEWRRTPTGLELNVTVPPNATARVVVPAARARDVREVASGSSVPARDAPSVRLESESDGRVVFEVGSGRYAFVVGH